MSEFEKDLRAALRREDPPLGFTQRVMARTRPQPAPKRLVWIASALAACLLLFAGNFEYRQYEGRKAKRELLFALKLTGSKLSIAQQKIFELNERTIHE